VRVCVQRLTIPLLLAGMLLMGAVGMRALYQEEGVQVERGGALTPIVSLRPRGR
jgi:hypothetical protein